VTPTRRTSTVAIVATIVVVAGLLTACGASVRRYGPVQRTASPVTRLAGGPPAHVAVIVMENEEFSDIIGASATPYINHLASRYALARSMFAISHPSLPNYLALTGGATFGITSDCTDCSVAVPGLAGQLLAAHVSWKAYMEDLPRPCFAGDGAAQYAKKHDPFVYYRPIVSHPASCAHVVPLTQLGTDERAHTLPRFTWITPNLCHDMHDCSPATGDRFLSHLVPPLLASLGRRGLLFLTWDEGTSNEGCCRLASGGHVVAIVAGPGARSGARLRTPSDHYSTLQAVEDLLGLARLRGAACPCTPSLQPLLLGGARSG
jgi:phosphatidylinositol-3-phosphatase